MIILELDVWSLCPHSSFVLICSHLRSSRSFPLISALIFSLGGVSVHPNVTSSLYVFSDRCLDYSRLSDTPVSSYHSGPDTTSKCGHTHAFARGTCLVEYLPFPHYSLILRIFRHLFLSRLDQFGTCNYILIKVNYP